nr:DUF4139 domain-containing protein [uncultured Flavobacterium sp.]
MRKIFLTVSIFCCYVVNAQKPVFTQAKIESARVYANAAELKHKTTAQVPSGTSEIVITNVANYLNENTIQISVPKYVTVMSVQFSNAYLEEYDSNVNSPLIKPVRDSLTLLKLQLSKIESLSSSDKKTIELLDKNQQISNSQNFSVAELSKLVDYYKNKRTELNNSLDNYLKQELELNEKIKVLEGKLTLNEAAAENLSKGKLIVNVMSNQAGNIPVEVTYLTDRARWIPNYDFRIDKINEPIQMLYKAQVIQNTGVDWKNVKLSLTSGLANANTQAPKLDTWFLDYNKKNDYDDVVTYLYRSTSKPHNIARKDVESRPNATYIQTLQNQVPGLQISTLDDFTQFNESQLNVTFDIDLPYNIISNGKPHSVALKEIKIPATYSYVAIPKLDLNAYLTAKIKDYGNYNILPGEVNVIFEDVYVGKTYINPNSNNNELQLSLGKDSNIAISRTLVSDKSGTKMLSSRKMQDFVYEISVRNNKKTPIEIVLEDQIPISSSTDIEVALTDKDGGNVNQETGKITWDLNVKPNETKKIRFGYQIKSAKDKILDF